MTDTYCISSAKCTISNISLDFLTIRYTNSIQLLVRFRNTNCAMFDVHIEIKLMIMLRVANIGIVIRFHYFCNFFLVPILLWFSSSCRLLAQFESSFPVVVYERDSTETTFLMYLELENEKRS